jgi:hypothetical protein
MRGAVRTRILLVGLSGALALAPRARAQTAATPPARENVRMLEVPNLLGFSGLFNLGRGTVRAVVIASPTCPRCAEAVRAVFGTLGEIPSKRLRAYVIFIPTLPEDTRLAAMVRGAEAPADRRAALFWDPEGVCAGAWARYLRADSSAAAGAVFLYDADAKLGDVGPDPLWMQRHPCVGGPSFHADAFAESTRVHVEALEAQARREQSE